MSSPLRYQVRAAKRGIRKTWYMAKFRDLPDAEDFAMRKAQQLKDDSYRMVVYNWDGKVHSQYQGRKRFKS